MEHLKYLSRPHHPYLGYQVATRALPPLKDESTMLSLVCQVSMKEGGPVDWNTLGVWTGEYFGCLKA